MSESDGARLRPEIDRLVDGELDLAERARLFARLDASPGGWRQCALAFLEARQWRETFAGVARAPAVPVSAERSRAPSSLGLVWAGLAGCVLLAFGLGLGIGMRGFGPSGDARAPMVQPTAFPHASPGEPTRSDHRSAAGVDAAAAPVELVGLVEDPESERVLPIVAGPGLDEEWLRGLPPPLTDYDRQLLERQGFLVEQGRRFVSVELRDGERVTIPIDLVNVQYVGQRIY